MPRQVDTRKTAKALRRLKRAAERAAAGEGDLSDWEKDFVAGVTGRLESYGSAFRDPSKGRLEEALSEKQTRVTRAIEKKTRPKRAPASGAPAEPKPPLRRSSFKPKTAPSRARVRDINEDAPEPPLSKPALAEAPRSRGRVPLRVVEGGRNRRKTREDG